MDARNSARLRRLFRVQHRSRDCEQSCRSNAATTRPFLSSARFASALRINEIGREIRRDKHFRCKSEKSHFPQNKDILPTRYRSAHVQVRVQLKKWRMCIRSPPQVSRVFCAGTASPITGAGVDGRMRREINFR